MTVQFKAMHNFHSDETGSDYCAGLIYTVRQFDSKLAGLIPGWKEEGLISIIHNGAESRVSGAGKIS